MLKYLIVSSAIKNKIKVVLDNHHDFERMKKLSEKESSIQNIMIRFTPGIECHTHEYIKTGSFDSKFGFGIEKLNGLFEEISKSKYLNLVGLHAHIGSQIFELDDFKAAANFTKKLAEEINKMGVELKFLDVGGGLGISYTDSNFPSPKDLLKIIENELQDRDEKIILEPGRSISGNAGIMISKIEYIKSVLEIEWNAT